METLLAGFFLDQCRRDRPKLEAHHRPSGLRRLGVAVGVIAIGFAVLGHTAAFAPAAEISVAASYDPAE